ncbi:hypothetical protein [Brucella endophytica]|uniref:hypothetical protein n=1 Tax=Brucella endophytica TaxID=1963359 RepID=UPI00166A8042|nr:hypothetical protein [Brucella endophytica]
MTGYCSINRDCHRNIGKQGEQSNIDRERSFAASDQLKRLQVVNPSLTLSRGLASNFYSQQASVTVKTCPCPDPQKEIVFAIAHKKFDGEIARTDGSVDRLNWQTFTSAAAMRRAGK